MAPFDTTAHHYDAEFTQTAVGRLQRSVVWDFLLKNTSPPAAARCLELNCGTGEDARWLAQQGYLVLATDVAEQMLAVANEKAQAAGLSSKIFTQRLDLQHLELNGPSPSGGQFDLIFSNFGGLNCLSPDELQRLGQVLPRWLAPGGQVVVVVMGRVCWWETLYFAAKGRFRSAARRWRGGPVDARLDAHTTVPTWYYTPAELAQLWPALRLVRTEAVGFWLPPSYLDPLLRRLPGGVLRGLNWLEKKCRGRWWAGGADHWVGLIVNC
jgi:SAM-dependent methyltransferase